MIQRIAIINGIRTPMDKAGGKLKHYQADDLATHAVKELLFRTPVDPQLIDEVIVGNVAQPAHAANIARVIALKAGLPLSVPAYTVQRNCASGIQAVTSAINQILSGESECVVVCGTESMSTIPLLVNKQGTRFFEKMQKSRQWYEKVKVLFSLRPDYLKPDVALLLGLTDPISGLIMGMTAENLAREFHISREQQDMFALHSHMNALNAIKQNSFQDEIAPIPLPPDFTSFLAVDQGPRENQTLEALGQLKPYFDPEHGTVTKGNSCPVSDGAAALLVMSEKKTHELGLKPLGYVKEYSYAALQPEKMGLGPVYATAKLLKKTSMTMKDIELIEINEAFASQVIANEIAFNSQTFCREHLSLDTALGELDRSICNVNGGAIALGHPVGMTGVRIILHLLKELGKRGKNTGLATLCIGGGQGGAVLLEVE